MSTPAELRELRFRRDVERLHRLGPRAVYELLSELSTRHLLRTQIEQLAARYSRIDPLALRLAGAPSFAPFAKGGSSLL